MRVTESRLDLASSHAYSASLEAHRQIQAWNETGRVELTEDVKVTLSGAEAAIQLSDAAQDLAAGRGFGPGLGRGMGVGHGFGNGRGGGIGSGLTAMRATGASAPHGVASAPRISAPPVAEEEEPDPSEAEITRQAWMLLIRMAGDEQGAARLAERLAAFARKMEGAGDVAAVLDRVVAEYGKAAAQGKATPAPAPQETWGYREDISVTVAESEAVSFEASATVKTADGREIQVAAAFEMARSSVATITASVRKGAALHDPLALSFTTAAPSVGGGTQQVDVDNDGEAESVAALAPGTAYLVLDRNGNGVVDDGSELFGPATQDGFGELAALDVDGSGWVDEGDAAFAQLSLWNGAEGSALTSLAQAGVGALATRSIATQYAYGATTGTLAASSIFLYEDGRAGFTGELELYA